MGVEICWEGFTDFVIIIEGVTNFVKIGVEIYWGRVYLFHNNNRRGYRFCKNGCGNLLGKVLLIL